MARLTVRNLDDDIVEALKRRAKQHGRSAEAEHRLILREALLGDWGASKGDTDTFFDAAARLRSRLGRVSEDGLSTTDIIRADRDRGHTPEDAG